MRFTIVAVGRLRDPAVAEVVADYAHRASRYWPLDTVEVRDGGGGARPSDETRRREGEALLRRAGEALVIACDESGERMDSRTFAALLQRWREEGRDVAFLLGGANGLAPEVLRCASRRISLAPWTLPHELARLVLMEQFYRAGTIVRGEPYHK